MKKGDQTRQAMIQKAAVLFNEKGYAAASMQDITEATGIQRGGIYNHFVSKEELAVASFEYATSLLGQKLMQSVESKKTAMEKLKAIATGFAELYTKDTPFPCGCPVLNTAVEAKREMVALREMARSAMDQLKRLVSETVLQGIEQAELKNSTDPENVAAVFVSVLEGAMLLSVLYDNAVFLSHAVNHLDWYVTALKTDSNSA